MKSSNLVMVITVLIVSLVLSSSFSPIWGFFGHRKINRMAVFILPQELIPIYKKNIEYVTEHAIDPDKRRYSTKREAPRHYIDIDHWGEYPFDDIPRNFSDALAVYSSIFVTDTSGTETEIWGHKIANDSDDYLTIDGLEVHENIVKNTMERPVMKAYMADDWDLSCDELRELTARPFEDCQSVRIVDSLSMFGIVPYHLEAMQFRLQKAFEAKDINRVMRLSAEMGHYIGDAHVPLHTTKNYNGQLTGQDGIHAFWESRIPELFANEEFDFFVGPAEYIENPRDYFWDIVLDSYLLVDSVLSIEMRLRNNFPPDQQFCYEERLDRTIRTQCKAFAEAYYRELDGMVEERMRDAVLAVGSSWYTAWVNAGQPDISSLGEFTLTKDQQEQLKKENELFNKGNIIGRGHSN